MAFPHLTFLMRKLQPDLNDEDTLLMGRLLETGHLRHTYAVRLRTVLLRARGKGSAEIADFLGIDPATVPLHIRRYNAGGLASLLRDKTRKPGKPPVSREAREEICRLVCAERPAGETHWSTRGLGKRAGISHTAVGAVLREAGLKAYKNAYSLSPCYRFSPRLCVSARKKSRATPTPHS